MVPIVAKIVFKLAIKNNEKFYVLRRQLVNPSQSHPSAASKQGREIGVGAI